MITNSVDKSQAASHGQGPRLTKIIVDRKVPARKLKLRLKAANTYAAPIQAMFNQLRGRNVEVSGDVEFEPIANRTYTVKGELGLQYSAVWLQDDETAEIVTPKTEKRAPEKPAKK